jgi:DNA repair protein RadC
MVIGPEGHRERLRERFQRSGLQGFHDHEVLELLLTFAIPRRDVKPLARELMTKFSTLAAVFDAPLEHLQEVDGIGGAASILISLIPQLVGRYQQDRWTHTEIFASTREALAYLASLFGAERNEVFYLLALNSRNALIAAEPIQEGTVNRAAVFPRQVVEAALKHRATAVILAHNHPGGDARPSSADRQLTRKLKKLLNDLDIAVHDHIIIAGPDRSFSFAEHGELE